MSTHRQYSLGRGSMKNTICFLHSPVRTVISFSMPHLPVFGIIEEEVFCFSKGLQDVWCFFIFTGHGWWHWKKKKALKLAKYFPTGMRGAWGDDTQGLLGHGRGSHPTEWRKKKSLLKGLSESEWDGVYVLFDMKCCARKWLQLTVKPGWNKSRIVDASLEKPKGLKSQFLPLGQQFTFFIGRIVCWFCQKLRKFYPLTRTESSDFFLAKNVIYLDAHILSFRGSLCFI